MLIKHKIKKGETFDELCRKYKIKPADWRALWALLINKTVAGKRKSPEELQPGDVLWFPDAKAETYIFRYKGIAQVFEKSEWQAFKKAVSDKTAATVVKRATSELDRIEDRYKDMVRMQKDHPIITYFSTSRSLDGASRATAFQAVDDLQSTVSGQRFANLPKAMENAEKALAAFGRNVDAYVESYIEGAGRLASNVKFTADASFTIAGAIAATMAAPAGASYLAIAKFGAQVGATTGCIKAVTSEIGRGLAGEGRSLGQISWTVVRKTLTGGAIGFLSGPTGKLIAGKVADRLAGMLANNARASQLSSWIVNLKNSPIDRLTGGAFDRIANAKGRAYAQDIAEKTLVKLVIRIDTAQYYQKLTGPGSKEMQRAFKKTLGSASGKESLEMVAQRVATAMETDTLHRLVFTQVLKDNAATLRQILEAEAKKLEREEATAD